MIIITIIRETIEFGKEIVGEDCVIDIGTMLLTQKTVGEKEF